MSPPIDEYILVDGGDFYKLSNSIKVYNCEFIDSLNHSMFKEHAGDLTAYMKVVNKQKSWCKTIADSHGVVFKLNDPLTACYF